jgi:hypothetical protein
MFIFKNTNHSILADDHAIAGSATSQVLQQLPKLGPNAEEG